MRQGRDMRSARRAYGVAAGAGGVALAVLVAAQAGVAAPVTDRLTAAASSAQVGATPEGMLEVLLDGLPEGETSHYAKAPSGALKVQAFVDDGSGPGLVRLSILDSSTKGTGTTGDGTTSTSRTAGNDATTPGPQDHPRSFTLPSGSTATVTRSLDRCVDALHVEVERPDGVRVGLDAGTCLAWDGFLLGQGRVALTEEEALSIADDPRLGLRMSSRVVNDGSGRFEQLASFEWR